MPDHRFPTGEPVAGSGGDPRRPDAPAPIVRRRTLLGVGVAAAVFGGATFARKTRARRDPGPQPGTVAWSVAVPHNILRKPLATNDRIILDGDDLVALHPGAGQVVWRLPGGAHHAVLADTGGLYAQQITDGAPTLVAVEVATGGILGKVALPHWIQAMNVADGTAYCLGSDQPDAGAANVLAAVDVRGGRVLWTLTRKLTLANLPVLDDRAVYVGGSGALLAVDRATGAVRWTRPFAGPDPSIRAVANGLVIARADGGTHALDPASGVSRWRLLAPDTPFLNSAAGVGDREFFASSLGGDAVTAYLRCVLLTDGRELWRTRLTSGSSRFITYRSVAYATDERSVVAVAAKDGTLLWRYALDDVCRVEPVGVGDLIVAATVGGRIDAIHTGTSRQRGVAAGGPRAVADS
jgi:outer membrane protein assembly factor BamB